VAVVEVHEERISCFSKECIVHAGAKRSDVFVIDEFVDAIVNNLFGYVEHPGKLAFFGSRIGEQAIQECAVGCVKLFCHSSKKGLIFLFLSIFFLKKLM